MNSQQISQSALIDILFEGRNKDYGAYALRISYNRRLAISLVLMITLILLIILLMSMSPQVAVDTTNQSMVVNEQVISPVPPEAPPLPPPPAYIPPVPVATIQYTRIQIVEDDKVLVPPPDMKAIDNAQISIRTEPGARYEGIIAPPTEEVSTQVVASGENTRKDDEDIVRFDVQVQATFPGGAKAWSEYIRQAIERNIDEFTDSDYGTCVVKFIVDRKGNVSDVEATTMKGSKLAELAVNAIRKGPKWIPAQQNGRYVNAYRMQPITLKRY